MLDLEIKRIFWEDNVVYGADAYGCNKFKIQLLITHSQATGGT